MEHSNREKKALSILENVKFWLSNGDAKVSFIISFTGVFLGFIFASDSINDSIQSYINTLKDIGKQEIKMIFTIVMLLLFLTAIVLISISVYFLLQALLARINPDTYKQPGLETKSKIFWGTIATNDFATFKQSFENDNAEKSLNDIQSQAYINSVICKKKFDNYNKGIKFLFPAIIVFVVFKLLSYIPI